MDSIAPRQLIGRYEVVGHLGAGGMAEIKLARLRGPSGFERPVVIKQILPHLARLEKFVDMFLDEARIVAGIRHPNVVQVHELGQHDGELFLVMEYLEGEGAGCLVRRMGRQKRRLGYPLCAYLVANACAGLHAAHELKDPAGQKLNLVHRDVTPQNLFVTYAGDVKVLDFGIAKAADRITKTEVGQIKGKYEYMSPEQCLGKPLDRRSDIFSLGTVLYELSTFRRPFRRENGLLALRAICEEPIKPPSKVVEGYPPELERICLKAMSRDRDQRYATAADMRRDLLQVADQLSKSHSLGDQLSRLMHQLFADRIEEKAEMLRRVRAGSVLTHVPAAEVDPSADLDTQTEVDSNPTSGGLELAPERRTPRAGLLLGMIGIPLAVGIGVWWYLPPALAPDLPANVAVVPTDSAASAATSAQPVRPASVTVHISSVPEQAEILLDGKPWGAAPASVELPRGDVPVLVELRRSGYFAASEKVVPDMDQRLRLTLKSKPRGAARPPKAPGAKSSEPSFYRFE